MHMLTRIRMMRIRTIDNPPADNGGDDKHEPGTPTLAGNQGAANLTKEQIDAIIERKLAKEREKSEAARKALEEQRRVNEENEKRIKEAEQNGYLRGQLDSKRQRMAEQYGISMELLPDTEEKLDTFEKELNATINSKRKVTPVSIDKKTSAPDWMGNVHA